MASQPDLTNIAISSGYSTLIHTEESGGVSGTATNLYDGDGTLIPMALSTSVVSIIDGAYDLDVASHDGSNGLKLGGTLVTASATELNYLDISSLGSAQASKVLTTDSNIDVSGIRNLTATGTIQASAFTATGDTTIGDSVASDTLAINSTITTNLVFEGSTANAYETTLSITDPTADRTWTIPDATDTFVGRATTDTLTNKTLTAPDVNTPDIDGGTVDAITSLTVANNVDIGSYDLRAGTLTADGLTSGRVVFAGTNGVLSDDSDVSFSGATLSATNLTSSGTVTFGSLSDGSITITAFVDEDGMDSNSATLIPTQQSVKAYVDAQVTAQDLDFQGDSGGALNIDLDSETLDIAGGTGIDTSGSSNTLTVAIDSTVATLTGSQTLTNKTLASPVITTQFNIGSATITEAELEILDGASVTTTELNIIDGDTSATGTTVADADRVVMNDGGTMKQVAVTDLSAYFDDEITAMPNLVSVGTLTALQVDNVNVNGNAITSTDSNGNIDLTPNGTGEVNISKVDIDSGTIDGATIATSDVTVGSGKTLDVSSGTLTLADNQISGNKVEGGTIASTTITALTTAGVTASANLDIGSYTLRASNFLADSQTSTQVAFYGTDGVLAGDSDMTFAGSTLTVTDLTVGGTLTTTGTVQEVSTTNLNVQDPLILLNKYDSQPTNNAYDAGIVIKRGSGDSTPANVAIIWDESANTFSLVDTSEDGTTAGNVSITDYENLRVGALTADDASTFTSTISTATGSTIGNLTLANGSITDSSGAISFGDEALSTSGTLGAGAITGTSFIIGSADIGEAELEILDGASVTTDELNLIDGGTARGTTAVASGDGILINDAGTMRMTNVDTVSTYFSSHNVGGSNIVTTGALSSGSIASGFGTISTGNAITTTGVGTFASLDISGDVDVDGTLETDALTIGGTTLAETISDTVGAMVGSNTETGIAVTYEDGDNTLDFVLGATQTTVTSMLNASLVAGRDADNQIKFSTDDEIIFRVAGGDGVTMKASGEIEATSLDISGAIDVAGTANLDVVDIDGAVNMAADLTMGANILMADDTSIGIADDAERIEFDGAGDISVLGANFGIGIAVPAATLHINTSANSPMIVESTHGDGGYIELQLSDSGGAGSLTGYIGDSQAIVTSGDAGDLAIRAQGDFVVSTGGATERFKVDSSGNVGIGVTNPSDYDGRSSEDLVVGGTSGSHGITIVSGTDSAGQLTFADGASGDAAYRGRIWFDHNAEGLYFTGGDGTGTDMVIKASGNVGIGTTSPDFLLDCEKAGSQNIRVHSTDDNAGVIIASDTDEGQISFLAFASGADYRGEIKYDHDTTAASQKMQFKVGDNAVTAMTILGNGEVQFNTAAAIYHDGTGRFRINDAAGSATEPTYSFTGDSNTGMYRNAADSLAFTTNGSVKMVLDTTGNLQLNAGNALFLDGGDNTYINEVSADTINFRTNGGDRVRITSGGALHVGDFDSASLFQIKAVYANEYIAKFWNDGDGEQYYGLLVKCGHDDASDTNFAMTIQDGDGTEQGYITFSGGTVNYQTFTGSHVGKLPNSDNDSGYTYGTLLETDSIFYQKREDGSEQDRAIRYEMKKTSSSYSKKVLGAYAGKYPTDMFENRHIVNVLGDGHILCNGEKGNIEVGDGICSSSTDGEGMKADKMAMIIGIAQEDVSFSGSESKLVAVQYGLQQFTPWS